MLGLKHRREKELPQKKPRGKSLVIHGPVYGEPESKKDKSQR